MGDVSDLVGHHGAANTGVARASLSHRLEERAVTITDATLEQVEQLALALGPSNSTSFTATHGSATLGAKTSRRGFTLLLHEQLLTAASTPAVPRF